MRKILINTKLLFLNLRPIPSDQAINIIISTCYNHSPFILRYTLSSYSHFFYLFEAMRKPLQLWIITVSLSQ